MTLLPPQIINVPFNGGSNIQRSKQSDSQFSMNWYSFYDPRTDEYALYPYMGWKKFLRFDASTNNFKGRVGGAISTDSSAYFVVGDKFFKMGTDFSVEIEGELNTNTGAVSMDTTGKYVTLVDGADQYNYDILAGTFNTTSNPAAPLNPTSICNQQGYILANDFGTQTLFQTTIDTPDGYFAFGSIQINYYSSPYSYPLLSVTSVNGRIFCFTTGFIQVLKNAKKAGFTFRPDEDLIFGYGTVSAQSVVKGTGGLTGKPDQEFLAFISQKKGQFRVMMTTGNPPIPISTPSIDYRLAQLTNIKDVVGNLITLNGQTFIEYSFTQDNLSIVYNFNTQEWFDISYLRARNITQAYTFFNGKHFALSYRDNYLYELSEELYTQDGAPIYQERVVRNFRIPGYKQVTGNRIVLWFEQGVGLPGSDVPDTKNYVYGADPEVRLYVSFDGGVSYEQPMTATLGKIGDRLHQTEFSGLGTGRDWTFKIVIQSPVPVFLLGIQFYYQPSGSTR